MVLGKFILRHTLKRPGRSTLTLLSVVIGVAAVVSVTIATATTRRAYDDMFATITGRAGLQVSGAGGTAFDQQVLETVRQTPGVKAAVPIIQRYTKIFIDGRKVTVTALGVDPELDSAVRDYDLEGGSLLPENQAALLIEANFAGQLGLKVGSQVKLMTRQLPQPAIVVGLLKAQGAAAVRLSGMIFMPLKAAQVWFGARDRIDGVQVVLEENADRAAVEKAIAAKLPEGLLVAPPAGHTQVMEETLRSSEEGLRMITAFSLLLAAFIILNTFLMNVGERRQQLSVMRAIGATRGQIRKMIFVESAAMGAVGTALGLLAGLGGAYVLSGALAQLMQVHQPPMKITYWPFVFASLFGFGVSLLGAWMPARRAAKLTPLEGLRTVAQGDMEGTSLKFTIVGLVITTIGASTLTSCIVGWLPAQFSVGSALLMMLGVVLLVPTVLASLADMAYWVLSPLARVELGLAHRQVLRHRARSTLTVGVLFVASSTGIGTANAILDNVDDVKQWYSHALVGDYFIRAMMPSMATGLAADLPDSLGAELKALPGIASIDTGRFVAAKAGGQQVVVIAREFNPAQETFFDLYEGDPATIRDRLREGQVVIGTVLAQRAGLHLGDELPVVIGEDKVQNLRIAAVTNEYMVGGMAVYMQREVARRLLGIEGIDAYVIKAKPEQRAALEADLRKLTEKYGLLLIPFADLAKIIHGMVAGIDASLWGILVLGFVVAAIGVVNTLTMNVLEQTRELGLLRIVAMTRKQVRRTVLGQAAILGLIGLVPGTLVGFGVGYLINLASKPIVGHPVEFVFRPALFGASFLAGLAIVLAAAWLPARRAAGIVVSRALQYE